MINNIKSFFLFLTVITASLVNAQNNYNLFLDCATNDDHFDCYEIRESLKIKLVNGDKIVHSEDESNISLKIRTREVDEAAVRLILVEQYFQFKGDTTPILIEIKKYRESDFNVSTVTDLANHIAVHLAKLRGVVSIKSEDDGVVVVFAKDKTSSSSTSGEEKDCR